MLEFAVFSRPENEPTHERNRPRNPARKPRRRDASELPRLRHERHRRARAAGRARRPEAGAPPRAVRHARAGQRLEQALQEVGPRGRRRHRQVPPARRFGRVRRHRAHGPAVLDALHAGRRPGQLRLGGRRHAGRHALHRSAHVAHRQRAAGRHRQGNGRFQAQLRRVRARAGGAAGARAEPAGQRLLRHRGGHGHQHSAAQPHRGRQRAAGGARRSGHSAGAADAAPAGSGFPDRRHHQRRGGNRHGLQDRPRPAVVCAARRTSRTSARASARPSSSPSCRTR